MTCNKCGAVIQSDDIFCPECGIKVMGVSNCPYCGGPLEPGDTFCGGCGKAVEAEKGPIHTGLKKEPEIKKVTPTQKSVEQRPTAKSIRYAGFWMRFFALLLDWIILSILFTPLIAGTVFLGFLYAEFLEEISDPDFIPVVISAISSLVYAFLFFLYFLICHSFGVTIGKKIVGIRLIKSDGSRPGFGRALLRETIGRWLAGLIFYLGYLWIAWDSHKQGWHDKVAGTFVIRTR
jgi:uncharacterized RDD family membrane protein YckC